MGQQNHNLSECEFIFWKQQNVKVKNVKVKENIVMEMVEDVLDMVGEVDTPKLLHLSFAS